MNKRQESINWDDKKGDIVITSQERISIDGAAGIEDAIRKIDTRLIEIVRIVKGLKAEAEALKTLKDRLKAGIKSTAGPVPGILVVGEVQSSSAVSPDPNLP